MAKKVEVDLQELELLASKGYTASMCFDAIGISHSKGYRDKQIMQAIKRGRNTAKQRIVDDLLNRSMGDPSSAASIFLAKKMKVFDDIFPTASPKTPEDASKKISDIYTAVSQGKLSEEKGNYLISFLEKFIKAFEVSELEKRVKALEEANNVN